MASFSTVHYFVVCFLVHLLRVCVADKELLCLVCNAVVEEIDSDIRKVNPNRKVQVGSFRLEPNGERVKSEIPYARSEMHIQEVLEELCTRMDDYAEARYKETGERTVMKLIGADGKMHPDMAKVDFVPNEELNKKLKFYCETIVDEFEDDILRIFKESDKDPSGQLCVHATGFCHPPEEEEEYDFEGKDEL